MKILVTGGAGFIGSHLARRLLERGHSVVVVDNLSTGRQENVPAGAELLVRDLSGPHGLQGLPRGVDAVCHLAAQSSGAVSAENPFYDLAANAGSTLLLSRWCIQSGTPRFVYASSMAAYGNAPVEKVSEDAPVLPIAYYGVSKVTSEHLLRLAAREGLNVTSFRIFTSYGPGQDLGNLKQGMVSIYLAYLLKGGPVPVTGSLERFRDIINVADVVEAWVRAVEMPSTPEQVYNLATGRPTKVRELLAALIKAMGLPADHPIEERPGSPSDQFGVFADTSRIRRDLGFEARVSLEAGLDEMVRWARSAVPSR